MRYSPQLNYHKRKRFVIKVRIIFAITTFLLIALASYAYYAVISREASNNDQTSTSEETKGYYASSVKVFRSPFFQIQLDSSWSEVPAESNENKYIYRSRRANLIEHELVIYIDKIPDDLAPNRVLPVNLKSDSEFLPIIVSGHCSAAAGGSRTDSILVTHERVSYRCDADSTDYRAMIGQVNGTTTLKLKRPNGTFADYAIYYTNLKANPDSSHLMGLAESFQTR